MHPLVKRLMDDWHANPRLRIAAMVALVILVANAWSVMDHQRQARVEAWQRDFKLDKGMQAMIREAPAWVLRERKAADKLVDMQAQLSTVDQPGLAKADMQAGLTQLAKDAGLTDAQVKVEDVLAVPGHPDFWQVMARIEGSVPAYGQASFVRALAQGLPWMQVERLEIGEGTQSVHASAVVRGYFRHPVDADGPAVDGGGAQGAP